MGADGESQAVDKDGTRQGSKETYRDLAALVVHSSLLGEVHEHRTVPWGQQGGTYSHLGGAAGSSE